MSNKEILDLAKNSYEIRKTYEAEQEKITNKQKADRLWSIKKQFLVSTMWNLGIRINESEIENFNVNSISVGTKYLPSIKINDIRFVYDFFYDVCYEYELWDCQTKGEGLRIYGPCTKYNGYNFPCGIPGLTDAIRSLDDLGKILSEGIKVRHACIDPFAEYW